jgi:hypothetical protein
MAMKTLRLRTRHDLLELLADGQSPAWKIAKDKEQRIGEVHIVNWRGTQRIEATFDKATSKRRDRDGRLIVGFSNARIVNCDVKFSSRNSVRYLPV